MMKQIKHPEKLSVIFFIMLLILLPFIVSSNREEKIILSKAEEIVSATPSATLVPVPTAYFTPTIPSVSPTQTLLPTNAQPTVAQPTMSPIASPTAQPTYVPSTFPSFVTPTDLVAIPFIYPTSSINPTEIVLPTQSPDNIPTITNVTILSKINTSLQSLLQSVVLPSLPIESASTFFSNVSILFNDIFGIYISSSQENISAINVQIIPIETKIHPTFNSNEYMRVEFREKNLSPGVFISWLDNLFKKERSGIITYEIIMNPNGFVYTDTISLSIRASHEPFDEPIDRTLTIANVEINEPKYFDRFGFINNVDTAYTFYKTYPRDHHRVHTIVVTGAEGNETNKNTPMTLNQWDAMGLSELRDEQGLPLSSSLRTQLDMVNFNPITSAFAMNDLYDMIRLINPKITRDKLTQLLVRDDRIVVRIE